ncbi:MAG: PKD domain-containing protein, partial [bacterium]|nr:PKD domain-containing protein [bacterium]
KNRAPKISSCRVSPTSGNISTIFSFQAEVVDADEDPVTYSWDVGDGMTLTDRAVSYQYGAQGIFKPQVQVSDQFGGESECFTAWVVIE